MELTAKVLVDSSKWNLQKVRADLLFRALPFWGFELKNVQYFTAANTLLFKRNLTMQDIWHGCRICNIIVSFLFVLINHKAG